MEDIIIILEWMKKICERFAKWKNEERNRKNKENESNERTAVYK
jgi:hypothetical protein